MQDLIGRPDAMAVKVTILRQVTLALRFLHCEMHLVHGDLKPANVLLERLDGNLIAKVTGPLPLRLCADASCYMKAALPMPGQMHFVKMYFSGVWSRWRILGLHT